MKSFENPEKRRKSNGGRRRARIHSDGRAAGETTARCGDAVRSRFWGCPYPSLVFLYDAPYLFGSVLPVLTRGDAGTYEITKPLWYAGEHAGSPHSARLRSRLRHVSVRLPNLFRKPFTAFSTSLEDAFLVRMHLLFPGQLQVQCLILPVLYVFPHVIHGFCYDIPASGIPP